MEVAAGEFKAVSTHVVVGISSSDVHVGAGEVDGRLRERPVEHPALTNSTRSALEITNRSGTQQQTYQRAPPNELLSPSKPEQLAVLVSSIVVCSPALMAWLRAAVYVPVSERASVWLRNSGKSSCATEAGWLLQLS